MQIDNFQLVQDIEIGDCQDEVILGMDFLKKHVTAMDFGRPSVTIENETIELPCPSDRQWRCCGAGHDRADHNWH